jgi:hypothetical protein
MIEFVFQVLAVGVWLLALPVLVIVMTPGWLIRALFERKPFSENLQTRYRALWAKWKDAFPIDELS